MSDQNTDADTRTDCSLDDAIYFFATRYPTSTSVDSLKSEMIRKGFDPIQVHEVFTISSIAFGRVLFGDLGIRFPKVVIRARDDGTIEPEVSLMSIPAYTRALALIDRIQTALSRHAFRLLCMYNAESQAIVKAVKAVGQGRDLDLTEICLYPVVVPDLHVKQETVQRAFDFVERLRRLHWPTGSSCRRTWSFKAASQQHVS